MRARLGAFAAIVFWGISFVATKAALREAAPVTIIFSRFALGVAFLALLLAFRREPLIPPRAWWPSLALLGFIGVFVHQMLQAHALQLTTAVHTGWLIGLTPIWSAILAALLLGERFGIVKSGGLALGFIGAVLVVTRGEISGATLALPSTVGDLMIVASTVNWAVYSTVGNRVLRGLGPTRTTAGAMFLGWLMLLPFFVASRGWNDYRGLSSVGLGAIVFLGIACSGLGYLFWYGALQTLEASRVASFLYLEPLVTLAAAMILLGERASLTTIAGGLLVLAGVLVVQNAPMVQPSEPLPTEPPERQG